MIYIASDHAGFYLKEEIKKHLELSNAEFKDLGAYSEESVDYPDYAQKVTGEVINTNGIGILICGCGIGMSITANRVKGIRAALCTDEKFAEMGRRHNNANILVLAGQRTPVELAKKIVDVFLNTTFDGDQEEGIRHVRRLEKIDS